jgi:hypothetical protein
VFKFGLVIVPAPDNKLHVPIPADVVFAAIVAVVAQTVWLPPATAGVGGAYRVIDMVDVCTGHVKYEIAHWYTLTPTPMPVTPVVGEDKVVGVPTPETTVHAPVPVVGVFAAITVAVAQID